MFFFYLVDTSVFHLPSLGKQNIQSTVFGISCYKQIDSKVWYFLFYYRVYRNYMNVSAFKVPMK